MEPSASSRNLDGPNKSAIRKAAEANGLPVDSVSEVSYSYFYH